MIRTIGPAFLLAASVIAFAAQAADDPWVGVRNAATGMLLPDPAVPDPVAVTLPSLTPKQRASVRLPDSVAVPPPRPAQAAMASRPDEQATASIEPLVPHDESRASQETVPGHVRESDGEKLRARPSALPADPAAKGGLEPSLSQPVHRAVDVEPDGAGAARSTGDPAHEPAVPSSDTKGGDTAEPKAAGPSLPGDDATKAAASAVAPAAPVLDFLSDVRKLQRLQDNMAVGVAGALPAQNELLGQIDASFAKAEPAAWQDPRNARALVIFTLSGGDPAVLRKALGLTPMPAIDERLLRGSLAYIEGREAEALKDLGEVDVRTLPDSLAGQVALAQAALWVRTDPARASTLLGQARLIAPGTLVEEAALRRQILVSAQANDVARLELLSSAYLARFRHSVYAGNFRQRFASALTRMDFVNDPEQFPRLDDLLRPLDPESRREIELMVAQAAVVQGKAVAAVMAADRVLGEAPIGSIDVDRARLYRGAAMAASADGFARAVEDLATVARARLEAADVSLLDAALATAEAIRRAPDVNVDGSGSEDPSIATSADPASPGEPPTVLAKAQGSLDEVDKILGEAPL